MDVCLRGMKRKAQLFLMLKILDRDYIHTQNPANRD